MHSEAEKRTIRAKKISRLIQQWELAVRYAIQTTRKQSRITQDVIAERIGWTQDIVSNVEKGRREISVAEFIVMAQQMGADPETVFRKIKL